MKESKYEKFLEVWSKFQMRKASTNEVRKALFAFDDILDFSNLSDSASLAYWLIEKKVLTFQELIDFLSTHPIVLKRKNDKFWRILSNLLENPDGFFDVLHFNNLLTSQDLTYLLNSLSDRREVISFFWKMPHEIIYKILDENVLTVELVDKLNTNLAASSSSQLQTVFDQIEYYNKNHKDILELNEFRRYTYKFNFNADELMKLQKIFEEKLEVCDKLKYIVDNDLENSYDFESLMVYLKKKEKKNLINI